VPLDVQQVPQFEVQHEPLDEQQLPQPAVITAGTRSIPTNSTRNIVLPFNFIQKLLLGNNM
jgi:hypothetical protein